MKRTALLAIICIILASCSSNTPKDLAQFVSRTERECDTYTADDWARSLDRYQALEDRYMTSDKAYTKTERQMAARAMGRYHVLLIERGINEGANWINEMTKALPDYIDGLSDGINQNAEGIRNSIKSVADSTNTSDIGNSIENLGKALEKLFEE